jgi:Ca2+-binding EF-hand superfamily protein
MMQKLVAASVAVLLSCGVVLADDENKPMKSADATFKSLDRDADERLSKTEVVSDSMLTDHFAAVDADSDGYLTKREYTAHMKDMKKGSEKKDY